jgi:Transposase DDE domain
MPPEEIDIKFRQLQQELPANMEQLAREHKAFQRAKKFISVFELMRAVMLCSIGELSLREIAGWFTGRGRRMTDEAVRGRLHACPAWLKAMLAEMLPKVQLPEREGGWKLIICDGSVLNGPGSQGVDYRFHLSFDPLRQKIDQLLLSEAKTGESLKHFRHAPNALVLGDRGLAKAPAMIAVRQQGAHLLVRFTPQYLILKEFSGRRLNLVWHLARARTETRLSFEVLVEDAKSGKTFPAYVYAARLDEKAVNRARRRIKRRASTQGSTVKKETLILSEWLLVLTTVPPSILPAETILELYRVRWQVELLIKRFKSLLNADALRAQSGSPLAEVYLLGKLLFGLLVEWRAIARVGYQWTLMINGRMTTWWRIWKMIAAEIKEAVLDTTRWDRLDWREMLNVLGERNRNRKLQLISEEVANWLKGKSITHPI